METLDLPVYALTVPLALGVVEVLKQAGLPSRWAGVAALLAGTLLGLLMPLAGVGAGDPALAALSGAAAGLSAAGVWSGVRAALRP